MELKESEFRNFLEKTHSPVVVDFFANWCGPCRKFAPIFEAAAKKMQANDKAVTSVPIDTLTNKTKAVPSHGQIEFVKIDIDNCNQLCQDLNIDVVPTIVLFQNGQVVARHGGIFPTEKELVSFIKDNL